jgi:hypothetical protein
MAFFRIALAILAFIIYGCAVLSLHPERHSRWFVEADFSLGAGVSYSIYGTPLGMANANVVKLFRSISRHERDGRISVQAAIAQAAAGDIPAGEVLNANNDGNGAGYPIFASLAMRLFGPQLSALTYSLLLLMGVSTFMFICRYQDDRLFIVPLQFFALTLMLLSPLATSTWVVDEAPIGGLRYLSVAGILPAFHIFFEMTDHSRPAAKAGISNYILLGLQVFVLTFVMFARGSVGYLLVPILLAVLFIIWSNRRNPVQLKEIFGKVGFSMVVGIAFVSFISATMPDYRKTGRLFGNVWHRAFVSFGLHPDWPFGNLLQVYDCADVLPGGLKRAPNDRNAHCVFWSTYPPAVTHELPDAEIDSRLLGGDYEKELRSAFFNVVFSYPQQVLQLHVYYKSAMILWTLRNAVAFDLSAQTIRILALTALQFLVFVLFVGREAYWGSSVIMLRAARLISALFVFSLLPLYVAFSYLHTSVDTIFFMYASAAIVLGVLVQATIEQVLRIPKSVMSTSAARLITVRSVAVSVTCAAVVWVGYNYLVPDDVKAAASQAAQVATEYNLPLTSTASTAEQVTNISELPPLPQSSSAPNRWVLIEGLSAKVAKDWREEANKTYYSVPVPSVVSGQPVLRLVAVGFDRPHVLGADFGDLVPGEIYRVVAWLKTEPGVRVMIEARDSYEPNTEKPSNYGVARFNLTARSVINSDGDIIASGVEAAADEWVRVWVDLRSRDGQIFASVGPLEGRNNRHVFTPIGQRVLFGGFEIFPPRVVKPCRALKCEKD